jgi:hypothetical protein
MFSFGAVNCSELNYNLSTPVALEPPILGQGLGL